MAATQDKQLKMWGDCIIAYLQARKKVEINVMEDAKQELFSNTKIKSPDELPFITCTVRALNSIAFASGSLPPQAIRVVLDKMCELGMFCALGAE